MKGKKLTSVSIGKRALGKQEVSNSIVKDKSPNGTDMLCQMINFTSDGMSGNGGASCAANMNGILQMYGFDVVDIFLARHKNFEIKMPMLEQTGEWLATKPTSGPPLPPLSG